MSANLPLSRALIFEARRQNSSGVVEAVGFTQEQRNGSKKNVTLTFTDRNVIKGHNHGITSRWFYRNELKDLVAKAEPGDLIQFRRIGYSHWAVYLGASGSISNEPEETYAVQFSDLKSQSGERYFSIHVCRLVDVQHSSQMRINNLSDKQGGPTDDLNMLIRRIEQYYSDDKPYNIESNNCEHFATFCRYGLRFSLQSEGFWNFIAYFNSSMCTVMTVFGGVLAFFQGLSIVCGLGQGALVGLFLLCLSTLLQILRLYYFNIS